MRKDSNYYSFEMLLAVIFLKLIGFSCLNEKKLLSLQNQTTHINLNTNEKSICNDSHDGFRLL